MKILKNSKGYSLHFLVIQSSYIRHIMFEEKGEENAHGHSQATLKGYRSNMVSGQSKNGFRSVTMDTFFLNEHIGYHLL